MQKSIPTFRCCPNQTTYRPRSLMTKAFILLFSQTLFVFMNSPAQIPKQPYIYLTGYVISNATSKVGDVRLSNSTIRSIAIEGEYASAFKVNKSHELSVKASKLPPSVAWFDITINVKTSSGELSKKFRIVKGDFVRNKVI